MVRKNIGIAFFYHESHSFTPTLTTLKDFQNEAYLSGKEILRHYSGTKTEVGGFIDTLSQYENVNIVPILCASAVPSGEITYNTYEVIERNMIEKLKSQKLDGLLIALHGAMVVENIENPEEELLEQIKKTIGSNVPIAVTLDLHANNSKGLLQYTSLLFGFKTYPHVDMYERGIDAAHAICNVILYGKKYYANIIQLPMVLPSINMTTIDDGPMAEMIELAYKYEEKAEILNVSIFGGFPYADVQTNTASIIIVGTDQEVIDTLLESLADSFWGKRDDFIVDLPSVEEAFELYKNIREHKPVVIADISDNPLSCGSGDTTEVLKKLIEFDIPESLFGGIYDPESLRRCHEAGEGSYVTLELGGKVTPQFGKPIQVNAEVIKLSDGVFYNSGPFNHNLRVDLLAAAYIKIGQVEGVLIGRPMSANDPEMFRHLSIEPAEKKLLCLKVKNHFRAAFDPLISKIIYTDAPGVATNNLQYLEYKRRDKSIWPFLKKVEWRDYYDKTIQSRN